MDLPAKLDESVRRQPSKAPALTRVVEKITSPPFLGMVGVALFVGWGVGFVFYHAAADRLVDANNIVLGRDFMAFYVGGSIVKDGNGERLYEPAFQQVAVSMGILCAHVVHVGLCAAGPSGPSVVSSG